MSVQHFKGSKYVPNRRVATSDSRSNQI